MINLRPRDGDDRWYNPNRDIQNITPAVVVNGAAYAASRNSSLYHWLSTNMPPDTIRTRIRSVMKTTLESMYESRRKPLVDALQVPDEDWVPFQAIMCGASIFLLSLYSQALQAGRMTNLNTRLVVDPVEDPNLDDYLKKFDAVVQRRDEEGA